MSLTYVESSHAVKHLLYGVSNVTGALQSSRLEPHESYARVASTKQLWVDDDLVPPTLTGEMVSTSCVIDGSRLAANVEGDGVCYDASGAIVHDSDTTPLVRPPRSGVCKKVRASLVRGAFGELVGAADEIDLRLVVRATPVEPGYHPVLERADGEGGFVAVLPHRWTLDVNAGVLTLTKGQASTGAYVITAYVYTGRRGIKSVVPTSTDDIDEGPRNQFLTRERFDAYHADAMATATTDHLAEGETNKYYSSDLFLRDVSELVNTDTIKEGVVNRFFTPDAFARELATKTLEDVTETPTTRHLTSQNLQNVDSVIGGVHALHLTAFVEPPQEQANRLYVANNELYFGSLPVGASATSSVLLGSGGGGSADASIGEFAGDFLGTTSGLHIGSVTGFLNGMVSSLANHPIIDADIIGTGQGQWVGAVAGEVVGRFEGAAMITQGYARNLQHVGIGTHDAEAALLHVSGGAEADGSAAHVRLTNSASGASVAISCDAAGSLSVGGDSGIVCAALRCTTRLQCDGDAIVHGDIIGQHLHSVGITNSFAGLYEIGVMDGVTTLVVDDLSVSGLVSVSAMHVEDRLFVRADLEVEKRLRVGSRVNIDGELSIGGDVNTTGTITASTLNTPSATISDMLSASAAAIDISLSVGGEVTADTLRVSSAVIGESLSVGGAVTASTLDVQHYMTVQGDISISGKIFASALEVPGFGNGGGNVDLDFLSVGGLFVDGHATIRGDLSIGGTLYAESLSTNVVVGTMIQGTTELGDFDAHLTAYGNEAILGDLLVTGTLHVGSIEFGSLSLNDFWCGNIHASHLDVATAAAATMSVGELTVGVVQGMGAVDAFPISSDAEVYGDMTVIGNVMISGLLITGAHNYIVNDTNRYVFDGHLSVQTLSIGEEYDVVRELQRLRDDIEHLRACITLHGIITG